MNGVALGLLCAALIAAANFTAAIASRKDNSLTVSFVAQVAPLPILFSLLLVFPWTAMSFADIGWGVLSGVAQIIALRTLFHAMAFGAMGLVSVINAFMGVLVPTAWAVVVQGEHLGAWGYAGALLGLAAIFLVARTPGDEKVLVKHRRNALEAVGSGTLFGLAFVGLAAASDESSIVPLLSMRVAAAALGAVLLLRSGQQLFLSPGNRKIGLPSGFFGAASLVGFVVASHADVTAVVSVVQGLAPIGVAVLAYLVLGQRLRRAQLGGFVLALAATALLAAN